MKHLFRVFSIFLLLTFSLNATKGYGQTGVKVTLNVDTICPGTDIYLRIIDTASPYPYVIPEFSYDGVNFDGLAQPDASHPIGLVTYDPLDDATILNWRTKESNTSTQLKKVWYRVSYWTDVNHSGTAYRSNVVSLIVRPAAYVKFITITNGGQVVCINNPALDLIPVSPVGTSFSWFKRAPGETVYSPILSYQNVTNPTLPSPAIPTNIAGTTYYKLKATYGSDCPADSTTTTVIVNPLSVGGTATIKSGTATICANTTAPSLTLAGNTGTIQWQSATSAGGAYADIAGQTSDILPSASISNTTTKYYRAKVTSGVCTVDYSNAVLVTVDPASSVGSINLTTQTICFNATPTAITLTNPVGTIQWQVSTTIGGTYTDMVGQTSATLPSASISNTA
ncbi:MAG: hypothetical protein NTZ82_08360, partial [Bacteroidetes bacterium]|nr:hypothetical protein [Bacteroidota bacterium]